MTTVVCLLQSIKLLLHPCVFKLRVKSQSCSQDRKRNLIQVTECIFCRNGSYHCTDMSPKTESTSKSFKKCCQCGLPLDPCGTVILMQIITHKKEIKTCISKSGDLKMLFQILFVCGLRKLSYFLNCLNLLKAI